MAKVVFSGVFERRNDKNKVTAERDFVVFPSQFLFTNITLRKIEQNY